MTLSEQLENFAITSEVAKMARETNDEIKELQRQLDAAFAENRALRGKIGAARGLIAAYGRHELANPYEVIHKIDIATSHEPVQERAQFTSNERAEHGGFSMSHDLNPEEQPNDVLFQITALRMMSPNGEMPKKWHDGFWRAMDRAHAEITQRRAEVRSLRAALSRFREDRERLLARIEFASQPIGACGHCLVGNRPGEHHLPDCPAFRVESKGDRNVEG